MLPMSVRRFQIFFSTDCREQALRDFAIGVSRYVATHPELELTFSGLHFACTENISFRDYHPDGAILCCQRPDEHPLLRQNAVKAAVAVHWWGKEHLPTKAIAFMNDDQEIARLAAEHLIGNRLEHFAFVHGDSDTGWGKAREAAFVRLVKKAGFACDILPPFIPDDRTSARNRLADFLLSLPKPCGVFTSFDFVAKAVIDCCRSNDIAVPEQIQVVGVDNDSMICDNTIPTLTSINAGFTEAGYAAVQQLHQTLLGKKRSRRVVYFKPHALVARGSTCDFRGIGRSVSAACEFMRVHALEPITPEHVAMAVRTSLRLLQLHFQKVRGEGIAEHLRKLRLSHASRLLRDTQMPLDQIPAYCCLGNPSNAKTLFRRTYGLSMSAFRRTSHPVAQP